MWAGTELHRVNPDSKAQMPNMRSLIYEGQFEPTRIEEAASLMSLAYPGTPQSCQHYTMLGEIDLVLDHGSDLQDYERFLDIEDSVAGIYYNVGNITYQREIIASQPANLIAMRLNVSQAGALSFNVRLDRGLNLGSNVWNQYSIPFNDDSTLIAALSGVGPFDWAAGIRVSATGGSVYTLGEYVMCQNCTEAVIYFQSWTSYRRSDPIAAVMSDLSVATSQSYDEMRAAHIADYRSFQSRVTLNLGTSSDEQKKQITSARMNAMSNGSFDPEMASLYFQFGRYLLISSSRDGVNPLPPNLQGLWNHQFNTAWGGKYTIDINLGRLKDHLN